jgi:uncharacterized protein (TIGR04141 family)
MSDSIQTSIYKLRSSIAVMDDVTKRLVQQEINLSYLESQFKAKGYTLQKLQKIFKPNHEFRLFYKSWETPTRWKRFIAQIAEPTEPILQTDDAFNEAFILLIEIKKGRGVNIYAITGGAGHIELQSYINYQFGLDILARLIKAEDKVLRAAKERNFVGGVLGSVKYFRGDYNLNENEAFGNYYHELRAKLDKSLLKTKFNFKDEELKRGGLCDAKSSFTIRKPLTFDRAVEIIDTLHKIIKQPGIELNLIKKLDKSDKALIQKLEKEFEKELFKVYIGKPSDVNVEICHRNFDKFYDAAEYDVSFYLSKKQLTETVSECVNLKDILVCYSKHAIVVSTPKDILALFESTEIISYDTSHNQLTTGYLQDHLCAEIRFNSKSYFLFNKEWYFVKPDFENILNEQCQSFINNHRSSKLLKKWTKVFKSENDFNAAHFGDTDTLVFDKITPDHIEACDVLKWNKNEVYFIHVKKGFNNEMRNLGRQVHISAKRILQDLTSGRAFLTKLYDELYNMKATKPYFINAQKELMKMNKTDFLSLFDNRRPVFILAVLDDSKKGKRTFANIKDYDSNIAKFCMQQLRQEMRSLEVELKVLEIESN